MKTFPVCLLVAQALLSFPLAAVARKVDLSEAIAGYATWFERRRTQHQERRQRLLQFETCTTRFQTTMDELLSEIPQSTVDVFTNLLVFDFPFLYKAFYDRSEDDEFLGANGTYTDELFQRMAEMEVFWKLENPDINTKESILMGGHSTVLQDKDKLIRYYEEVVILNPGFTPEDVADTIQYLIEEIPRTYTNPVLTANAVAIPVTDPAVLEELGSSLLLNTVDSIVVGDGVIEIMDDLGLGVDGPDMILAHEFAHVLQFELELEGAGEPYHDPAKSRHKEMMADAIAAYFMAHPQGGKHEVEEVDQLHLTVYEVGSYNNLNVGFHGYPAQRECAALWAAGLAFNATGVMSLTEFIDAFEENYEDLVDTDPALCPSVVDKPECDEYGAYLEEMNGDDEITFTIPTDQATWIAWLVLGLIALCCAGICFGCLKLVGA